MENSPTVGSAIRLTDSPTVYLLPGSSSPLIGVLCENLKDAPFPDAVLLMRDICGTQSSPDRKDWDQHEASHAKAPEDIRRLAALLHAADGPDYSLWNFSMCVVPSGPFAGACAVGIGSNAKKRERAGCLALALTAASRGLSSPVVAESPRSPFGELATMVRAEIYKGSNAESTKAKPPPPPPITQPLAPPPPPPPPSPPVEELSSGYPLALYHANDTSQVHAPFSSVASDLSEDVVLDVSRPLLVDDCEPRARAVVTAAAWLGPDVPVEDQRLSAQPAPSLSWEPFTGDLVGGVCLPDDPNGGQGVPTVRVEELEIERVEREGVLRRALASGSADMDTLTIATLGTADSIPMGTDLDPLNAYNNAWAAGRVADPHGKALLTHDLAMRVLDAENLGFTYGQRVLGREHHFDVRGVKKAVAYFLHSGVDVIVVGKRPSIRADLATQVKTGRCQVLIADDSDDVFILKKAFESGCPIVSRDNFRQHKTDIRINPQLRRWCFGSTCGGLGAQHQVKFTSDEHAAFVPDYDYSMPVLRPGSSGQHARAS